MLLSLVVTGLTRLFFFAILESGNRWAEGPGTLSIKLRDLYLFTRELYFGSCEVIKKIRGLENPPRHIQDVHRQLSTVPAWIELWKRSSCRAGLIRGLSLAKAYHPNLDPSQLMKGFPEFNVDGSPFDKKCYLKIVKQTRHAASEIAKTLKLKSFQNAYDVDNEEIFEDEPPLVDLLQSYNSTSGASTSGPVGPDHTFESLVSVTWKDSVGGEPALEQTHDPAAACDVSTRPVGTTDPAAK